MKKKGVALIYLLIIMVPVMLIALSVMELAGMNFKISRNIMSSKQARYNSEAGIIFGLKKLEAYNYNENINLYNNQRYLIYDNALRSEESQNYTEIYISYFNNKFTLTSTGYYRGFKKSEFIEVNKP